MSGATAEGGLLDAARAAKELAYAPYSEFRVGAALQSTDGRIFTGCNVENVTLGLTVCAERVALFKAVSEGANQFTMLAVVAGPSRPTPPCGACRQVLWEFCGDLPIVLANLRRVTGRHQLRDLLPIPFDGRSLA